MEGDDAIGAFEQVLRLVAHEALRDHDLVVGRHVHEDEVVAIVIGVLQRAVVDGLEVHLHAGIEGLVHNLAGQHVLDRRAYKGGALARLDVLELDDLPQLAVQIEDGSVLDVVGSLCQNTHLFVRSLESYCIESHIEPTTLCQKPPTAATTPSYRARLPPCKPVRS